MHRTFISTIIAAALTITGISSTMAQAGEYRRAPQVQHRTQNTVDPLAATIAGFVALAIIGKAIDNNGGFKKKSHPQKQYVQPQRSHKQQRAHNNHRRNEGHRAHRGHNNHRQFSHNNRRANEWHRHGNGHGHRHPHGPRHHRGRH
jgi:hypothetical protein